MDPEQLLPDALLERIRGRAAGYDREECVLLRGPGGTRRGGLPEDLSFRRPTAAWDSVSKAAASCQRRLATAAPATALAVNMHLVWTGVAQVLAARGDSSLDFVLAEAAAGRDFRLRELRSRQRLSALRLPHGRDARCRTAATLSPARKIFTSLSPAWTRLGIFGKDSAARDGDGELVHGFIDARILPATKSWTTGTRSGMRASQSNTTVLDGAVVPADRIFRKLPVGPNADPLIFAIFACFETLLAAVYTGIGERALLLGVEAAKRRTSFKNGGRSYAQDPDIRWKVAEAAMAMDALYPQLARVAADVDDLVDHGSQWFPKLVGLKVRATETARTVVDLAIRVSGGSSYFRGSELERLYRDVLAGMFHPSDDESAHNTVANAWLGPLETLAA